MKALSFLSQAVQSRFSRNKSVDSSTTAADIKATITPTGDNLWQKLHCSRAIRIAHPPVMFGLTVMALTGVVGYQFYNQPQLSVDTLSPYTVYAPMDGVFYDEKTTEEKRKEARTATVPRLHRDLQSTQQLKQKRGKYFDQINQLRKLAAPFPFLSTTVFSLENQARLRQLSDESWSELETALRQNPPSTLSNPELVGLQQLFEQALDKQTGSSSPSLERWLNSITQARSRFTVAKIKLSEMGGDPDTTAAMLSALQLDEATWKTTQQTITQVFDRILVQGLPAGIPPVLLTETIQLHLRNIVPPSAKKVAQNSLLALLHKQHNLTVDTVATKEHSEQAALAVKPVNVALNKGEVIVKAGSRITQEQFILLDGFGLSQRQINWQGLLRTAGLVSGAVLIFCGVSRRIHRPLRRRDHILLCLLSLSAPVLSLLNPRYTDLPAIGLLTSSFYGPSLAVTQVLLVSGLSAFAVETITWDYWFAGVAAGVMASLVGGRLRSRDELALLGGGVGLVQGGVYFASRLVLSASASIIWYAILPGAIAYGAVGFVWCVVAIGISPYLERFFDVVTPIRLVELSNPNCPLLQRLAKETPGTFQHTLFVACLAESAARELRCNVELVRTGTLYHDIGKMHDPLGFIENQMGGLNKHDEIADPYVSVEIIKKHVTEGIEMARKYGLPKVVRDFIPEHQGKLLVSYFYFQAKENAEEAGNSPISEANFRYAGPIPQSRETGIVMLADSAEAALRSLKDPNPEKALGMINRIFKARWRDNQLKDSGIRYEELPIIADVFVRVWQQFHHQRIAYPKAALEPRQSKP